MRKKCLITGITGQDGSYLAEYLIEKNYEVHGIIRQSSGFNTGRIKRIFEDIHKKNKSLILHYANLLDESSMERIISKIMPVEIYNLGSQSHVRTSFDIPIYTSDVVGLGALRLLETIRNISPSIRYYQASSSEMYGKTLEIPQKEETPFYPRSPYACAKVYAHYQTINYREAYGIHASNGILFNHESPRRGETFVTKKITTGIAKILAGIEDKIYLGNLKAKRDWGYAKDYVEAMWLMLQQQNPDDYVIATGETHSVKEFLQKAFDMAGLDYQNYVVIDKRYYRPTEVDILQGDYSKAKQKLGWKPKTSFEELIRIMLLNDLKTFNLESKLK